MTTPSKPASGLTCKWDAWNHLIEVKDGATVVAKYEYDGLARRTKKHVDSRAKIQQVPNGIDACVHVFYNSTVENTDPESLQPKYQFVWSQRYIDAAILRDENTDNGSFCDDASFYYLGDANFNVTTLVDTAGDAIERYVYSPYGVITTYDATWSNIRSSSTYDNEYTYTGRRLDKETGIYQYRHRGYTAQLGRFLSRDPIGYADGPSLGRAYFAPNGVDPTGTECRKYAYAAKTWVESTAQTWGLFQFGYELSVKQHAGTLEVCDSCCADGSAGKVFEFDYRATIDAKGYAKHSYTWNGLLGFGILQAGYDIELFARATGDVSFRGSYRFCNGSLGGMTTICGTSVNLTVSAVGRAWGQATSYFRAEASVAGTITCPMRFCADLDIGSGAVSNFRFEGTGPCSGNVTISGHVTKPGQDIDFSTCILGNCPVIAPPPPVIPPPPPVLYF